MVVSLFPWKFIVTYNSQSQDSRTSQSHIGRTKMLAASLLPLKVFENEKN